MAVYHEIQVSVTGVTDDSFSPLATIADGVGADSFVHSGVTPGQLYIYRARRYDDATGLRSDWSCLVFVRVPFTGDRQMSSLCTERIPTGDDTDLYIALEPCPRIPMKARTVVPDTAFNGTPQMQRLTRAYLRNSTSARRGTLAGPASLPWSLTVEPSPESGFLSLMVAAYTVTSETLSTPTRYRHTFKNQRTEKTFTLIHRVGSMYRVYTGCSVGTVRASFAAGQQTPVVFEFTGMALDLMVYHLDDTPTAATLLGISGASEDTLDAWAAQMGTLTVGSISCAHESIDVTFDRALQEKRTLCGVRGARKYQQGRSPFTGSIRGWFDSDEFLSSDLGQVSPSAPYGAGWTITNRAVTFDLVPPNNASSYANELKLVIPYADLVFSAPVEGEGPIFENLEILANDPVGNADATDHYWQLTVGITAANLVSYSQGAIEDAAASVMLGEWAYGIAKSGASTISIASDCDHLSSTNDYYNGRMLTFKTGTYAGVSKLISDYVGSTHTFTTAAFAGPPAAGDIFVVE